MANVIKPKRSSTSSSAPTTSNLADGEIAVNTADQKIYMRAGSSIVTVADVSSSSGGISNVVEDTTPQLGGNLDLNSKNISGTGNISTTGNFTLTSTDAGSAAAPEVDLVRNSSSPADSDYLGQIKFTGENDAGQSVLYAKITGKINDASDTTEDGLIEYAVKKAGSNTIVARLTGTALKLINSTGLEVAGNITVTGNVDGRDVANDGTKLDGIEASADVTDTTNVVAALTAGTNVTIAANGTISSSDTNTTYSVGDGGLTQKNFTTALNTKLSGIETGATANQTASEILTAIKTVDGSGSGLDADTVDGSHASSFARNPANAILNMSNFNIQNVNQLTFNDPGPNEGIQWNGGNIWKIYESPDNLSTNSGGNLQFVKNTTRSMTLNTDGDLYVARNITAGGQKYPDFNTTGRFYLGNNDWSDLISGTNNGYSATHQGVSFGSTSGPIPCRLPIDPNATYRITVRVKHISTSSGSGKFYFAVQTLNENFSNLSSDTANSYNYGVAANQALTAGQVYTYSADFSGYNTTSSGHATKFDPEGKYFDLYYITNYQGGGETVIQSVEVERISEGYLRGDTFDTSSSGLYLQGGSYNAGTDTETAPLIIDEGDHIYTKDGGYLRKLIGKTTGDTIEVGQSGTSLIGQINLLPGNAGNSAVKINGSTVWNAGNDGTGSGLDADLLDGQEGSAYLRSNTNGTLTGSLTIGNGAANDTLEIKKADNNVSDHIKFFNGTTRMGEIGTQDTTWLRINQVTNKNIYTPRYIRADSGFYVDGTDLGITGTGVGKFSTGTTINGQTAWHAGNDGSGSGLDADTVDSLHGTDIVETSNGSSTDLNNNLNAQMFSFATSTANRPQNYGQGLTIVSSGKTHNNSNNWATQIAFGTDENSMYFRGKTNAGSWNSWRTAWHSGNDGAGSGLDADLLDGQQGSYYRPVSESLFYKSTREAAGSYLNLNTATTPGIYRLHSAGNHTGHPTGSGYGFNIVLDNSDVHGHILLDRLNGGTMHIRAKAGTTWNTSEWNKVWTTGNDGTGSGLDADLLDGVQGSAYARLSNPTFTGNPEAPTASTGTNTTQLATTAFVQQEINALKALLYAYDQS
jgi:hypothetical protein